MCGIITYYNKTGISKKNILECINSLDSIKHRGPDGEGIVLINTLNGEAKILKTEDTPNNIIYDYNSIVEIEENYFNLILGHRRLSIFDTSIAGHQPMKSPSNNWIVFNGEIYNFIEIKTELKSKGYTFKTRTDTEVILTAYQEWGVKCLTKFNGMWSIIIWDNLKKIFFISNDRFGVKPLYYYKNTNEIIFMSEVKQIHKFTNRIKSYNTKNFHVFLESGFLDFDDTTFYKKVNRFRASHFISEKASKILKNNHLPYRKYYTLNLIKKQCKLDDAIEEFRYLFNNAVTIRLRSDVPFGVTLSGGLDSSSIIYETRHIIKEKTKLQTFSAIFPDKEGDESEYINFICKDLNLTKNTTNPMDDFIFEDFKKHIYHQDFPIPSTSYYAEWCVAKLANRNNVKIILNGQGADEVFAGYHHHFYKYCKALIMKGRIFKYLKEVNNYATLKEWDVRKVHKNVMADVKLAIKFQIHLKKLDQTLSQRWNNAKNLTEILNIDLTEATIPTYLRSDDRDGMAFGIESRHPFMDYRLINFGFSLSDNFKINNGWQKLIIRDSMEKLPDKIRWRKDKKGYTTPQNDIINKYQNDLKKELNLLSEYGIKKKPDFRHYSLSLWLKENAFS